MKLLILIWWKTFFVWCTQYDKIGEFKNNLQENIFACKELTNESYIDILTFPVERFYALIKWKTDLEKDKQKMMDEKLRK
jgi:hypothetical protein